jgi:hypothetical protein
VGISEIRFKTVWFHVDRLKVSFLGIVEAELDGEQLGLEQPSLDRVPNVLFLLFDVLF